MRWCPGKLPVTVGFHLGLYLKVRALILLQDPGCGKGLLDPTVGRELPTRSSARMRRIATSFLKC
jgi:hypothetical protein